jgi:cephalosporin hydroxylase
MKIIIDTDLKSVDVEQFGEATALPLYSKESFELITELWVKVGWNEKYSYTFTWMGQPIIQLPADMFRVQEAVYTIGPDVILETGVAHGGSLLYYASLCKTVGKGRVIGVDIEIRSHNREAIESHKLSSYITLIEGDSIDPDTVQAVKQQIRPEDVTLVILDSNHTKDHVLHELEAYYELVSSGSYVIVTDGIMKDLCDVPRGRGEWKFDNPYEAVREFVTKHPDFEIETPAWLFNESELTKDVTYWSGAWIRKS